MLALLVCESIHLHYAEESEVIKSVFRMKN
jgi:hypothetical protein